MADVNEPRRVDYIEAGIIVAFAAGLLCIVIFKGCQ
jgi:hypothetical protein